MRQPRLMKLNISNGDGNYLSSDVISIAFAYFLNPPHPNLKCAIQFFLTDNSHNLLQGLEKTGLHQSPESVRVFLSQ
jgi:hypothetical protein